MLQEIKNRLLVLQRKVAQSRKPLERGFPV